MNQGTKSFCGIDFGTSNSTVGVMEGGTPRLVALEGTAVTLPSAVFYDDDAREVRFGRAGIAAYSEGSDGRLLRALKSILGTGLMQERTLVWGKSLAFTAILQTFISHLKAHGDRAAGQPLSEVVLGRPVQFVDNDPVADRLAENTLADVARAAGFRTILFQYEPIAAALDYERQIDKGEQLALIADIGGGTSDISVVRVGPERTRQQDRQRDILANLGVHVGGTDFDRALSLAGVMPALGYRSLMRDGSRPVPSSYFFELATWHRINGVYTPRVLRELSEVGRDAAQPELLARLTAVIEEKQGHALAGRVEAAKVALSGSVTTELALPLDTGPLQVLLTRAQLNEAVRADVLRIRRTIDAALGQAEISAGQLQAVFLTGGSTLLPVVRESIAAALPGVPLVNGDRFGSVGLGLTLEAARRFGPAG